MNAPTRIAQVTGAAGSNSTRVLKIEKPQGGQAITAEASYDGTVKIDFSSIANEKITLVHIGERLIILFDNQSTVTIIPFFDSMGVPLANLTIESNGKEFTGAEFASTFPITTDQSVLPAAGDAAGTPAAGANFSNASVDPLLAPNPLPLLGPEDLPPINFTRIEGPIDGPIAEVDLFPSTSDNDPVSIDEDDINIPPGFSQGIGNTDSPGDDQPIAVSGVLKFLPGTLPATVDFASMHLDPVEGKDSQGNNLALTSQGHDLVYVWSGDTLKAVWASDESHVVFQIELNPTTGAYTVTLFDQLDHPFTNDPSTLADDAAVHGFEDNLIVNLTYTVTDADGQTATGSLKVDFDDDMPHVTGAVESRIVDEDDIKTPWSHGTSPNDGDADGSITENSTGAAFVSGTLSGLVNIGADEVPVESREQPEGEDTPPAIIGSGIIFSFTADVIAQMEALGLYSKQSAQPATENGLPLTYTTGTSGDWQILSAFEPDAVPGLPDTGNPVFELRVNQITGAYEFRLFDELIHQLPPGFPNGSDENFGLRSGEPDPVTGQAIVNGLDFGSIIQVTDYDGDSATLDGKFIIQIRDDVPHPDIDLKHSESVIIDETPGDDGADDQSFGSLPGSAQTAFGTVLNTANDPDVPSVQLGAIGFAHDDDPIVFNDTSVFGADHPPASQLFSLAIVGGNGVDSGLDITEGNSIFLFLENGVIVGRVQGGPFDGEAAFAVHINQNGEISVAQWLSIKHDDRGDFDESNDNGSNGNDADPNDTPNPIQQTLNGKINAVLTVTDSDGDAVSDSVGVGDRVIFQDDGPCFKKLEANEDLTHDETPGIQDDDVDVSNVSTAALNAFAAISNPGDDPHVPPASGPIGYAVSSGSILDVQVNYGADGQGAPVAYELVLDNNNIHSGLTTTDGRDIHLFKEGNIIVGRYEVGGNNVPDGSADEPAAFAIYIDPTTGQTTVVQYVSLHHPDPNNTDEEVDIDGGVLFAKVTVVDGDGDSLTEYVDIGSRIEFDDDAPTPTFTLNSNTSVIHDETVGVDADANDVLPGSLATLFNAVSNKGNDPHESAAPEPEIGYAQSAGPLVSVTANFGADGPAAGGGITYTFDIPGSSVASGLFTTEGLPITLFQVNSQVIVGRFDGPDAGSGVGTSDPAAFAIQIDPTTGVVTVVQYVSIRHDDRGDSDEANDDNTNTNDAQNPNDSPEPGQQTITNNALQIIATVTDGDGDDVSQSFNVGNKIIFQDDGPIADINVSGTPVLVLDETDSAADGDADGDDGIAGGILSTKTILGVSLFTSSHQFGVDGPAAANSTVYSLTLSAPGVNSGLVDTATGSAVLLTSLNATTIEGRSATGNNLVFTISVNGSGDVTVTQLRAIVHDDINDHDEANDNGTPGNDDPALDDAAIQQVIANGALSLTATITDGDGDSSSDSIELGSLIRFEDDGPDVNIVDAPNSVDENQTIHGTWTLAAGSDGVTSVDITVGLVTQTLQLVPATNTVVFNLAAGTLTVDADLQWHFTANTVSSNELVTFSIKATDGDGDFDTDSQTITVVNGNNPLTISGTVTGLVEEEHGVPGGIDDLTSGPPDVDLDVVGNLNNTTNVQTGTFAASLIFTGDDGALAYSFAPVATGTQVLKAGGGNLTSNEQNVLFHRVDGDTLVGYVEQGGAGYDALQDRTIFTLELNQPGAGDYTFTLHDNLDHHPDLSPDNIEGIIGINLGGRVLVTDTGDLADDELIANFTINVIDDVPDATDDNHAVAPGTQTKFDLLLVVDVSQSMQTVVPGTGGLTRIELARDALLQLVNNPNVDEVKIVRFRGASISTVWMDKATALAFINTPANFDDSVIGTGGTNYDAALFTGAGSADNAFDTPPSTLSDRYVFFLSDGEPTAGGGISPAEEATWINFLDNNNVVKSVAVGFGDLNATNENNLEPIAWQSPEAAGTHTTAAQDNNVIIIADEDLTELGNILEGQLSTADGNVLSNDPGFGADGGYIKSIIIDGVTYTFNGAGAISETGAPPAGYQDHGTWILVPTAIGGQLVFYFADTGSNLAGDWQYTPPASLPAGDTETFQYTLVDGDGDTTSADLNIDVPAASAPYINAPAAIQYWSENITDAPVTFLNRISFQDPDGDGTVRVTFTSADATDTWIASNLATYALTQISNTGGVYTLEGAYSNINHWIADNGLGWNPGGVGGIGPTDRNITVEVDANLGAPGGVVASTVIALDSATPVLTNATTNLVAWNLNGNVDVLLGAGNDTVITSWSHGPSATNVQYDGQGGTDTAVLVFTPAQLDAIFSTPALRDELLGFADTSPTVGNDELVLGGSEWNAETIEDGFEAVGFAVAAGHSGYVQYVGNDLTVGTSGNDPLNGGIAATDVAANGNDVLVGLAGNDTIWGGAGNDLILGGDGNDQIHGGNGLDVLSGGRGADTYFFSATDANGDGVPNTNADIIVDYSFVDGDSIDLSALLDTNFGAGDSVADFVKLVQTGANITVQVDVNGATGGVNFVDVAVLAGYGTSNADIVRVAFESQTHQVAV